MKNRDIHKAKRNMWGGYSRQLAVTLYSDHSQY